MIDKEKSFAISVFLSNLAAIFEILRRLIEDKGR